MDLILLSGIGGIVFVYKKMLNNDNHNFYEKQNIHHVDTINDKKLTSVYNFDIESKLNNYVIPERIMMPIYKNTVYKKMDHNEMAEKGEYIDFNREIKDLFTTFVNENFFSSSECLFNFLNVTISEYELYINEYRNKYNIKHEDLFFVYKGGNILRILSNDFINKFPSYINDILIEKYEKYFGRSDTDFAIYINPNLENYDKVFSDITFISYIVQLKLRDIFNNNKEKFFDYYKFSDEYKKSILLSYFNKIKNLKCFNDENNEEHFNNEILGLSFDNILINCDNYEGRKDIGIQLSNNKKSSNIYALNNNYNTFYISMNEALSFISNLETNLRIKFNLIRTKVVFNLFTKNNNKIKIAGELIDVSIGHKDEFKVKEFFEYGYNNAIRQYKMKYNNNTLNFYSYSLEELSRDLENILFIENVPWDDSKYVKRVYRYFYLCIIDIFTKNIHHNKKLELFYELNNYINKYINNIDKLVTDELLFIINKYDDNYLILRFFNDIILTFKKIKKEQYNKFNEFLYHVLDNITISISLIEKIIYYENKTNIDENNLYDTKFKNLIGGYISK